MNGLNKATTPAGGAAPGGTPLLRFDVAVNAGQTNTLTLILADGRDSQLDSTVFLSAAIALAPALPPSPPSGPTGLTEADPILPSNEPEIDGFFLLDLPSAAAGETIWIDPPASVGFTYTVQDGPAFASVTALRWSGRGADLSRCAGLCADADGSLDLTAGAANGAKIAGALTVLHCREAPEVSGLPHQRTLFALLSPDR